ncbi:MAG: putative N-acetyl-LL-diaminopimelate aminotransferase [Chloroflexi bacterium ADurb.Bin325]|nr:MAG: putative N-acetyl-LL-diaminopimelate aminotransferase [Chloroflexi bacterium ADurb.Bin325]
MTTVSKSARDFVAPHVRGLPKSGIRDFFDIVAGRKDVISLGIGEPDFQTPWHIREKAIESIERGATRYTSNLGTPELRQALAGYMRQSFRAEYDWASEILVTVGVSEAFDLAVRALLSPGDEVLYHEPCFVAYAPLIRMAHGVPVAVLNREDTEALADFAIRHDLVLISDEVYSELTYEGGRFSMAAIPRLRDRLVFLNGFSKAWSMTGFRLGYVCAPAPLTDAMMKIHQFGMMCASSTSQIAGLEALGHGESDIEKMRDSYHLRRNFIVASLNEMGLDCFMPRGAFYVFPSIQSTGLSSQEFALRLLNECSVACVPGSAFGACGAGFLRCAYATGMDQLKEAMERMAAFVKRL